MKPHPRLVSAVAASVLALGLATFNTGCFAVVAAGGGAGGGGGGRGAGAGAGAVAYVRGELEAPLDANFDRALRASQKTIEQLKFAKVSEKQDALVATLVARNADDKRIEIRVESQGANRATVKIRVGILGDESLSMTILDKIKASL
jgi:hypothetical protein